VAKYYYRPYKPEFANKEDLARFPKLDLVTVDGVFGGWKNAQETHFNDGGVFDSIYRH
jgi:sulfate transport system substrate-binding protein